MLPITPSPRKPLDRIIVFGVRGELLFETPMPGNFSMDQLFDDRVFGITRAKSNTGLPSWRDNRQTISGNPGGGSSPVSRRHSKAGIPSAFSAPARPGFFNSLGGRRGSLCRCSESRRKS